MEIKKAEREKTKFLGCLYGYSGSGKTYSALELATGLGNKIGFIDTENRRASYYADNFDFDVIDLKPPFTPERMIEAVETLEKHGCDVIVVDSMSHEWEGTGGCCEIAETAKDRYGKDLQGLIKWSKPKIAHKKMMNKLLQCDSHLILCCRAKELVEQNDDKKIVKLGNIISQEKNFKYEMFITFYLDNKLPVLEKCPEMIKKALNIKNGDMINRGHGKQIKQWLDGGSEITYNYDKIELEMNDVAENGLESLKSFWASLPKAVRDKLEVAKEEAKIKAEKADEISAINYGEIDNSDL